MITVTRVLLASVLFYLVSNPTTYKLVDNLVGRYVKIVSNGMPTPYGILIHTAVFALLFWILSPMTSGQEGTSMMNSTPLDAQKQMIANLPINKNLKDLMLKSIELKNTKADKDIKNEVQAKIGASFIDETIAAKKNKADSALAKDKSMISNMVKKAQLEKITEAQSQVDKLKNMMQKNNMADETQMLKLSSTGTKLDEMKNKLSNGMVAPTTTESMVATKSKSGSDIMTY
jgi:hypothetical protein